MKTETTKETYVTSRQAAELLGLSLRTIQLWVENGILKAWKTAGGHRRITQSSIDALLRDREKALEQIPVDNPFTVVIVEDEEDMLDLLQAHIKRWNLPINIVTANNGFEGLLKIGQWQPQLIFTDLNMPGMDGFHMIESLLEEPNLASTNIAIITGLNSAEIEERGHFPDNITIFSKPVDFVHLENMVRDQVANYLGKPELTKLQSA